ncbi:MAG: archease [Gemmatimonadota bacterium]
MDLTGIRSLDHTADVGLEVEAPDLAGLFLRGARGMLWLMYGKEPSVPTAGGAVQLRAREVSLSAEDLDGLFRDWLREVLAWHDLEGKVPVGFPELSVHRGEAPALEARVLLGEHSEEPIREIKGVTLHGLAVERAGDGWRATVIFDV